LAPGKLDIVAGTANYTYTLPQPTTGTLNSKRLPISPLIYGVNWPKDANYIKTLGVTISRWGGNAVTAYNPFGHFTNAGSDWFFQNRGSDSGDDWVGWVQGAGSDAILTVPALDWVSKDTSSYSYPKSTYPGTAFSVSHF
jgi:Glycoside hydrolase family 44